jgi:hypothetical protein
MKKRPELPDVPEAPAKETERSPKTEDIIRIEDLAPREHVKGGRKIMLGEVRTPINHRKIPPKT